MRKVHFLIALFVIVLDRLAKLVVEHRLPEDEAFEVAHDLAYHLVKKAYRL